MVAESFLFPSLSQVQTKTIQPVLAIPKHFRTGIALAAGAMTLSPCCLLYTKNLLEEQKLFELCPISLFPFSELA